MDSELRDELVRDEGLRLKAYKDTNGFWTIGVGHLLGSTPRMTEITKDEAFALLVTDVEEAEAALQNVFGDIPNCNCGHHLCDPERVRYRALVNMAFNRGEKHMRESTTITPAIKTALQTGKWAPVSTAIMASPWAKQIGARANRLAQMLETGIAPDA